MQPDQNMRLARARCSLEGLAVGDAFGECFFVHPNVAEGLIASRAIPDQPWHYTDDTQMALSIIEVLRACGEINQERLAQSFADHYEPGRGYGPGMHSLLRRIRAGADWQTAARGQFSGQGSWGNGAAMRIAPLGAYFADDLAQVVEQARRSAEVTHTHPEAIAGAIAVAVAAACAWQRRQQAPPPGRAAFLDLIVPHVPQSEVATRIRRARDLPEDTSVRHAIAALGNSSTVSSQDTVPFTLWCAAQHLDNYEEAIWLTLSALGDRDTTCAIVGGIVAPFTGIEGIPADWLSARGPFPAWPFGESPASPKASEQ
jgi:ADP-ribosylglycohydrolase